MGDQKPINLDAINTPEAICMFRLARQVHFLLIRWFFKELNKIPSDDAKIFALMYCGMISMKHPKLEMIFMGATIFVGGLMGILLNSPLVGVFSAVRYFIGGIVGGLLPILFWYSRAIVRTRRFIPQGLEELGYQKCPICGWYFDEDSDEQCLCKETDTNEFLE